VRARRVGFDAVQVTHIELKNWRNFQLAELDIGPRLFIVGPNAAGKSNFLDAIRFLRDITVDGGGLQQALKTRGDLSRIRNLAAGAFNHGRVKIAVTLGNGRSKETSWEYALEISTEQRGHRRPVVHSEIVRRNGKVILERPEDLDREDPDRLTQTHLEQVSANGPFRAVADFLATTRYLHLIPQLIREPERGMEREDDPYGGDFLKQVARTPQRRRTSTLARINRALKIAVPQLDELRLEPDDDGRPHLEARYQHWRKDGARQDERDFSDGTLRLIGLLWVLGEQGTENRGPVLLEEPEMSLHSSIVRLLPTMLSAAQQQNSRQIFVSTHASEVLRDEGLGLDEVALLIPSEKGTIAKLASEIADLREEVEELGLSLAESLPARTRPEQLDLLANLPWG
jgi:predicted ATPase